MPSGPTARLFRLIAPCCRVSSIAWLWSGAAVEAAPVDFNREIRPIFSEHCYACHGPDENKRKAGLRLDRQEEAFRELKSGVRALVPGDASKSAMAQRIASPDPDEVMPPPSHQKPLSAAQIEVLDRWIKEGAVWQKHWSFVPPVRPTVPVPPAGDPVQNAIDAFIVTRLRAAGFHPSPEADRATLLRRVTLDLTGLPPTIEEVDAFLGDPSPTAYDRVVERLLASPRFGERMAQNWLDAARFADTNGYHFDGVRFLWLWRDWVINAFNTNIPYDRFTLEQLAGDLLPGATPEQRIATGFLRNNMTNDEGGADPDEYLNKYAVDRVSTVGAVWLGLTVGCAECHDHKYDPMTTKEFYRMYAFFNQVPEKGLDRIRTDNPPPRLSMPTPEQARRLVEAEFRLRDAEKTLQDRTNELGETQEKWERHVIAHPMEPTAPSNLVGALKFDGALSGRLGAEVDGRLTGAEKPEFVAGRLGQAWKLDGKVAAEFNGAPTWDRSSALALAAWVRFDGDGAVLSRIERSPGYRGLDVLSSNKKLEVHLIDSWPGNALKVRTKQPLAQGKWLHVAATYDGSGKAAGVRIYVDGMLRELEVEKDQLTGSFATTEPLRIGARNGEALLTGQVDDLRIYDRVLSAEEIRQLNFEAYAAIVARSRGNRTDEERADLARFYKQNHAVDYLRSESALAKARKEKEELMGQIPTSLVMEEMDPPRTTHLLIRGDFRNPGEVVTAGTPGFLPPLPAGSSNRLHLARWLTAADHPLMARVTVNRYWAMLFGTGLVKTVNDFGSQGEWPSHPELLEWLACEFRDGDATAPRPSKPWDVKSLIRQMVTSATYRQSAAVTPEMLERDPNNRLLTRGPRVRLDAEFIRDQALAVSGLMNPRIGGPSVKPYQPPGLWDGTDSVFVQDHGDLLYRRGLYVFWRRSAHYPAFATFDAPNREVCTLMRQRTQTPLQSLVLMNDPAFVEAARGLAQRVTREEPGDLDRRLVRAFRHALGRSPAEAEISVLKKTYDHQLAGFGADPKAAESLLKVGETKVPETEARAELAAMTAVANVLLNLNETITK